MFEKTISKKTLQALDLVVQKRALPPKSYLAGGTAAALHLGHRYSFDLDFFTPSRFDSRAVAGKFKTVEDFALEKTSWQTVLGYIGDIQCTLFYYQYPLLFRPLKFRKISVADIGDLAAMKIAALSDRGTKRDFIDLYFMISEMKISLKKAMEFYGKKFGVLEINRIHILKSLVYFEDAEKQKIPRMIKEINWITVKKFFEAEVKKLA